MKIVLLTLLVGAVQWSAVESVSPENARVIAAVSTWTQLSFVTSTTTIPYTCVSNQNPQACRRRNFKKRSIKAVNLEDSNVIQDGTDDLTDSLGDPSASTEGDDEVENKRDAKLLALTIWSSSTSTFTMLMTSTNTALTYSVSFYCSIVGGSFPPSC